jgi:beta-N-acetylhexosaminidase
MVDREIVERFGQLFIMAFDGLRPSTDSVEYLRTFGIGGLILFEDNFETADQLRALTVELQAKCAAPDLPLFICSDHEGGRVQRFHDGFTELPAMSQMGQGDPAATEALHRTAARELRAAGINLNLAPVADVCPAEQPGTIGDRSFGGDPDTVAAQVVAAVRGLQGEGVLACAKHFPGQGGTTQDGHREIPTVSFSWDEVVRRDLVPFRAAVAAGVGAVMTAHVQYPSAGDPEHLASLSSFWLRDVLRHQLGFQGLVMSDALEMKGIMTRHDPFDSGFQALGAGTDIVLYYKEEDQFSAFYELRRALEDGDLDPGPVAASQARVRRAKQRWLTDAAPRPAG